MTHVKYLNDNRFSIVCDIKSYSDSTIREKKYIPEKFSNMPEEDFKISGTFIQAIKRFLVGGSLCFEEVIEYIWFV